MLCLTSLATLPALLLCLGYVLGKHIGGGFSAAGLLVDISVPCPVRLIVWALCGCAQHPDTGCAETGTTLAADDDGLLQGRARYHPLSERVTRPTLSSRS
jgi:hypothetical protein